MFNLLTLIIVITSFTYIFFTIASKQIESFDEFDICEIEAKKSKKCSNKNDECFLKEGNISYKGQCKYVDSSKNLSCVPSLHKCEESTHCKKCYRLSKTAFPKKGQCRKIENEFVCLTPEDILEAKQNKKSTKMLTKIKEFKHILDDTM
jgi:hypothetical protein